MPDESLDNTPVVGDGVLSLSLPPHIEEKKMPIDLSENVANITLTESVTNMQAGNRNGNGAMNAVMAAIAGTVQTNFAEVGVLEGRAVSGVNATDLGGPTNKGGA